ncbi:MAG: HypC/HybG/HupF family hydrogenase formation chaperone [Patescibacteria group bacterium]
MCLSIPHKVISVKGTRAKVQCGKKTHSLDVRLLKNIKPGDYLLNENQFAVYKLSKRDAEKTQKLFKTNVVWTQNRKKYK